METRTDIVKQFAEKLENAYEIGDTLKHLVLEDLYTTPVNKIPTSVNSVKNHLSKKAEIERFKIEYEKTSKTHQIYVRYQMKDNTQNYSLSNIINIQRDSEYLYTQEKEDGKVIEILKREASRVDSLIASFPVKYKLQQYQNPCWWQEERNQSYAQQEEYLNLNFTRSHLTDILNDNNDLPLFFSIERLELKFQKVLMVLYKQSPYCEHEMRGYIHNENIEKMYKKYKMQEYNEYEDIIICECQLSTVKDLLIALKCKLILNQIDGETFDCIKYPEQKIECHSSRQSYLDC